MDEIRNDNAEQSIVLLQSRISTLESALSAVQEKQEFFRNLCEQKDLKLRNWEAICAANHREPMSMVVENFMLNGRTALKKISSQMQLLEFDPDNLKVMDSLIEYVYHLLGELETLRERYK